MKLVSLSLRNCLFLFVAGLLLLLFQRPSAAVPLYHCGHSHHELIIADVEAAATATATDQRYNIVDERGAGVYATTFYLDTSDERRVSPREAEIIDARHLSLSHDEQV